MSYFNWRVIEPWCEPDGANFFSATKSFLTWADMKDPKPESKTAKFVADCRRWGYNAMALYLDPDDNPEACRAFATHLKKNGMGMIIRRVWNQLEGRKSWPMQVSQEGARTSQKFCPYSRRTEDYWRERIGKDFVQIPDLCGYRMSSGSYFYSNGAPWMCDCEECRGRTERERTRDAIRLVASLLAEHGGTLFWEICQDDPVGMHEEAVFFDGMTGEIHENAVVLIKTAYDDYHADYPRHPLFDSISKDEDGKSPYITSIQLAGEYRGVHKFPWAMADEWSVLMHDMVRTGQTGLWVMALVRYRNWDHPLNMVNWYAASRFMDDPLADPKQITLDWASETFGSKCAPTVVKVLDRMTKAAHRMYGFRGLWTQCHSEFPTLDYLDLVLCGPKSGSSRRKGMMGQSWPLDMYSPQRIAEIKGNPATKLVFSCEPITNRLKAEMIAEKEQSIKLVEEAVDLWRSLEGSSPFLQPFSCRHYRSRARNPVVPLA